MLIITNMGCAPGRIEVIGKLDFTVNSKKLPKVVLEGFGQVIKTGVLITSRVVETKILKNEEKVEVREVEGPKVEDLKGVGEVRVGIEERQEEVGEKFKVEEKFEEQEEEHEEEIFIEAQMVKTSELEESASDERSGSEISPRSRSDPRRNTEKPVFENMAPVLIVGFE